MPKKTKLESKSKTDAEREDLRKLWTQAKDRVRSLQRRYGEPTSEYATLSVTIAWALEMLRALPSHSIMRVGPHHIAVVPPRKTGLCVIVDIHTHQTTIATMRELGELHAYKNKQTKTGANASPLAD